VDNDNNGSQIGTSGGPIVSPVFALGIGTEPGTAGGGSIENTIDFGVTIGNSVLWLIDEDYTLSTALRLWRFKNYRTPSTTVTDFGRIKYRRPGETTIRDIVDAGDIEGMAINRYSGQIFVFSTGRLSGSPSGTQALWTYNLNDADDNVGNIVFQLIGHITRPTSGGPLEALAYDPESKRLYTADPKDNNQNSSSTVDRLYYLDTNALNANPLLATPLVAVGDMSGAGQNCHYTDGLEFREDGALFAVDGVDDHIYEINPDTGAIIAVSDNNIAGGPGGSVDVETMAWDEVADRMIAVDNSGQRFIEVTLGSNGANIAIASYRTGVPGMPSNADLEASAMYDANPPRPRVGVGNLVFIDANHNGRYDSGEGVNNVVVELYQADDGPGTDAPIAISTTSGGGLYNFDRLLEDSYYVHIPARNFVEGAPLFGYESMPGTASGDDSVAGEDGIDTASPDITGISTSTFALTDNGEPTTATGETGVAHTSDDADDNNTDLTIDLGFRNKIITVGDLVWNDVNNDGIKNAGESGVAGVTVQLLSPGADNAIGGTGINADSVIQTTTTNASGNYSFSVTTYTRVYVRITPPSSHPLASSVKVTSDNGVDNDNNGTQTGLIGTQIVSPVIQIGIAQEPGSTGTTNIENTIDFGIRASPVIPIMPETLPNGIVGSTFNQTLTASGGSGPYTYAITSGSLPAGLSLVSSTGVISGTPTSATTATFTVTATDTLGSTGTRAYSMTPVDTDFGDWNGSGAATASTSSTINSNLRIGTVPTDAEASVTANSAASADDNSGADDEDLVLPGSIAQAQSVTLPVTVFNNTGANAYLQRRHVQRYVGHLRR